jgi:hypothetical protein
MIIAWINDTILNVTCKCDWIMRCYIYLWFNIYLCYRCQCIVINFIPDKIILSCGIAEYKSFWNNFHYFELAYVLSSKITVILTTSTLTSMQKVPLWHFYIWFCQCCYKRRAWITELYLSAGPDIFLFFDTCTDGLGLQLYIQWRPRRMLRRRVDFYSLLLVLKLRMAGVLPPLLC